MIKKIAFRKNVFITSVFSLLLLSGCSFELEYDDPEDSTEDKISAVTTVNQKKYEYVEFHNNETQNNSEDNISELTPADQCKKAYAEFLEFEKQILGSSNMNNAFLFDLNNDDIPELGYKTMGCILKIYGYDGKMVYHICDSHYGQYSDRIDYIPEKSMILFDYGSVMADSSCIYAQTFTNDGNRLRADSLYAITEGNLINYLGNSIIISSEDFCNLFEISKESWIATGYHDSFISNEDIQSWIETE